MAVSAAVLLAACGASLNSSLPDGSEPKLGVGSFDDAVGDAAVPKAKTKGGAVAQSGSDAVRASTAKLADGVVAGSMPGNSAYKIGAFDVLEVQVFQVPELSRSAQVSDSGTVSLALIGEYPVVGRTVTEVERDLTRQLKAKYLQNPQVTVMVKEFNSQRITIEGAVKKTGAFPLRGRTTLLQALSYAEGLNDSADTNVVVFRQTAQGRTGARFDLSAIRGGQAEDPLVQSGDMIVVGTSFWKEHFGNFTKLLPLIGVFALL